ncbi:TPA: toprim domain-containing protein [Enterococcus faecium]|nr:toprim domain-containing protein [Enterococcus faecium]MBD9782054.1 toprim domain-containing protein [Enterococcus faecium]MCE3182816.1 toprim domain-containing protein [Enterococcus faecium]MCW8789954.1 toprim domain-containing protein [Enterococcus faecium]MCW8792217.1 toprim domain-containing protein [Enterococcus faecium]MCW8794912.1 toprim domain-containing protein [Enterococcus faecium]
MTEKKMSLIDRCKQIDIVDFARNNGMAVVNKGRDYRLEDHDSFVFDRRKQRFYWNSQNISGDIIELAKLFFIDKEIQDPKQQFKAATDFILKNEDKTERVENLHFETEKYKDHLVDYQPLTEKGRNYLKEERKLPDWLIDYAEKEGLIAELKPKHERQNFLVRDDRLDHAVAFLWKDPQTKETVGASYQGTFIDYERFGERGTYKHIDKNSTANHGFNLKIGDPKQLKFFESSIDLLSYAALNRDQLNDTWLVSMEGLKHHVISHYFGEAVSELRKKQAFPQSIEICVDNDHAGHIFYEKEQLMGAVDPFTNQKVRCERGIANDWQVPREYKVIYEEVAKEEKVTTEAIMAIHKTENNLQLTNQLVSAHKVNASFGQQLSFNDSIEVISLKDICREVAKELKDCELSNGTYDFDRFYQGKGDINSQILFSYKAEQYYKGYKNHEHEFVPEVKKDWNDQLKHEIQQQEIRKQKRAMLFQQGRQQERE